MLQSTTDVMSLIHKQLPPVAMETHEKEIFFLPEAIEDDVLEGIIVAARQMPFAKNGLLIATNNRIVLVDVRFGNVAVGWKKSYDELDVVTYSARQLHVKSKKGLFKEEIFELSAEMPGNYFLDILRRRISILVEVPQPAKLSNKVELTDDNVISEEKASAIDRALRGLSIMEATYLSRGEISELPSILWEDELPEAVVSGYYHNGYGLLVATDRRLVFIDKGFRGLTVEDFYFEDISSIETHQGWMSGSVNIYARGNKEYIENVPNHLVRPFADFLRNKLALAKQLKREQQRPVIVASANASVADELVKLAGLRAQGLITDEEFDNLKSKLIGTG